MRWSRLFSLLAVLFVVGCSSSTGPRFPESDEDPDKPENPDDPKNGMNLTAPVIFMV